jgi:hypothetical protein
MIGTIGFLVQEATNRRRWLIAASLYTVACSGTALLLGALLGELGRLLGYTVQGPSMQWQGAGLVGLLAIAYALSDLGLVRLPRPTVMQAVPVTWWRRWQPYGAALLYGAALGLGVTTRIAFGSFYILCVWCVLRGDSGYGALVMGTYGLARALVMFPASCGVYRHRASLEAWFAGPLFSLARARTIVAAILIVFGAQNLVAALLAR